MGTYDNIKFLAPFTVAGTNIFPIANSLSGGQLMSEFNLRSRESVGTSSTIPYMVGHSFVHSMADFHLNTEPIAGNASDPLAAALGTETVSGSSVFYINPGIGVINGHYLQSLLDIRIDLAEIAWEQQRAGKSPLSGKLEVGLLAVYSTEETMAYSLKAEGNSNYYEGIKVVIAPEGELVTPLSINNGKPVAADRADVTADLIIGGLTYRNGRISDLHDNSDKLRYIDGERIRNIEKLLDDNMHYLSVNSLNNDAYYAIHTEDESEGYVCDISENLYVLPIFDSQLNRVVNIRNRTNIRIADTVQQGSDAVRLKFPVKPSHHTESGVNTRYGFIDIPGASGFDSSDKRAGLLTEGHINTMRTVIDRLNSMVNVSKYPAGHFVCYLDELNWKKDANGLDTTDREFPAVGTASDGSYIVVGKDNTVDPVQSTMYIIVSDTYATTLTKVDSAPATGLLIDTIDINEEVPYSLEGKTSCTVGNATSPFTSEYISKHSCRVGDYFKVTVVDDSNTSIYYWKVSNVGPATDKRYSDPIMLTGQMNLATPYAVGGFYDVNETEEDISDRGYVYLDDNGHLRLFDYDKIRLGMLAYQLGCNQSITFTADEVAEGPSGMSTAQAWLNEYINEREAFPNQTHYQEIQLDGLDIADVSDRYSVIDVAITLPSDNNIEDYSLTVSNIDSKFNTAVRLKVLGGSDTCEATINIVNCSRIWLDVSSLPKGVKFNVTDSCVYYDIVTFNLFDSVSGLSMWFKEYSASKPQIFVDGLTVRFASPEDKADVLWNGSNERGSADYDGHFSLALESLTFNTQGVIVGCDVLVADASSDVKSISDYPVVETGGFSFPDMSSVPIPLARLSKPLKVSGTFMSAYNTTDDQSVLTRIDIAIDSDIFSPEYGHTMPGRYTIVKQDYLMGSRVESDSPIYSGKQHLLHGGIF